MNSIDFAGIGMTSQRTRERLIKRLEEQGISDQAVLDVIKRTPRHLFLDEALAHRAYEDTALPIGFSQTLSQPYIVARMTEILLGAGPMRRVQATARRNGQKQKSPRRTHRRKTKNLRKGPELKETPKGKRTKKKT